MKRNWRLWLILMSVFIVATCSLTYELLIGTASSYLTGSTVLAYSLSIGLFLSGLGLGAFCSRVIKDNFLHDSFLITEISLALFGGFSVVILYLSLVFTPYFNLVQIFITVLIGFISGIEIPVLTRLLSLVEKQDNTLKNILANVLSFDYLGGLAASLLFPLILLPYFGLASLGFAVGLVNLAVSVVILALFWESLFGKYYYLFFQFLIFLGLISSLIWSNNIYNFFESRLYRDPIIYSTQTSYQRIVLTKKGDDERLYLNGGIQFSSTDEYRYHESLVHPTLLQLVNSTPNSFENSKFKIAILGGGDGLAVREALKYEGYLEKITLVDIDPKITELARKSPFFTSLNENSLSNSKVEIINEDVWVWAKNLTEKYDAFIIDLPDPDETSIARLYTKEFYTFLNNSLSESGWIVTQSSGVFSTPKIFWSINKTMNEVFENIYPYHSYIPSFGNWGFNMASKNNYNFNLNQNSIEVLSQNRFIDLEKYKKLLELEKDVRNPYLKFEEFKFEDIKINTLDNLILTVYGKDVGLENF